MLLKTEKIDKKIDLNIQFLRAISIIFVVLFHYQFVGLKGGFIGVDIFFVISGFLITKILVSENKVNLKNFYFKRFKRIFPSLVFVIFFVVLVSSFIFSEIHFERIINSSIYSILGISNLFFMTESGYFDFEKLFKPLLHTWSLGIEIQFYILWSIIVFWNIFKKNLKLIITCLFVLSFLLSILYSHRSEIFFYFTGLRIFEFCIGSYVFFLKNRVYRNNFILILSLIVIIYCAFYFDENFKYPGIWAALPCISSAIFILYSFKSTNLDKLFNNKIIIFFGKISYTLYLVHWPLLVLFGYYIAREVNIHEKILLIFFSIIISHYLYELYEKNFLDKSFSLFSININTVIFFGSLISIVLILNNYQYFNKLNPKNDKNYNLIISKVFDDRKIQSNVEEQSKIELKNNLNQLSNKKKYLVVGDSLAFDFYHALKLIEKNFDDKFFLYKEFDYFYCFKKFNKRDKIINFINYELLKRRNSCEIVKQNFFVDLDYIDKIILSSRWEKDIDYQSLFRFFLKSNKQIIIIGKGQSFFDIPTLYMKKRDSINKFSTNIDNQLAQINMKIVNSLTKNMKYFDRSSINCNPECLVFERKNLLYSDTDHWSLEGVKFFSKKILLSNFFRNN